MDSSARRYARMVQRDGTYMAVIKELISGLDLTELRAVELFTKKHVNRHVMHWVVGKKENGRNLHCKIKDLDSSRIYMILKARHLPRRVTQQIKTVRLEAEMRGILVDGVLKDPAIDYGQRSLPPGLLEQCKDSRD